MLKYICVFAAILLSSCMNRGEPEPILAYSGSTEIQSAAKSTTSFGLETYRTIQSSSSIPDQSKDNLFISPASLSTAFGLLYPGARGETETELRNVLDITLPTDAYTAAMGGLSNSLEKKSDGERLAINNALWLDEKLVVEQPYSAMMKAAYNAGEYRVDYRGNPNAARLKINDWVADNTENLIKDLLAQPNVDEDTRAVLVNTIYMKADWASPFTKEATRDDDFYLTQSLPIKTPMMRQEAFFKYDEGQGYAAVEMPYQNRNLSMVVFLPSKKSGLAALERRLLSKPSDLEKALSDLSEKDPVKVDLKLPKVKLKNRYPLKDVLKDMGMARTFSNQADFSGMVVPSKQPDGDGIKIGEVIHQTFLEIDEKGTEAAAATAIVAVRVTSLRPNQPTPISFHAEHPFMLLIKDNETGMILFMGRVSDPR